MTIVAVAIALGAAPALAGPGADASSPESGADRSEAQQDASGRLQEAMLAFERGDLGAAADGFHVVLDYPVKVRTRRELHNGFLHYAYTLFLQNSKIQAKEKLGVALQLDPEHQPSPVILRPDLYQFYQEQRAEFLGETPGPRDPRLGPATRVEGEPPEPVALVQLFPELQRMAGVVDGRFPFVPIFGVGLYKLGHRVDAGVFGTLEVSALSLNAASVVMRAVVFDKRTPSGDGVREASRVMNVVTFFVFWPVFIVEMIVTFTLQKKYTEHPEDRPRIVAVPRQKRLPPALTLGPDGLSLAFW